MPASTLLLVALLASPSVDITDPASSRVEGVHKRLAHLEELTVPLGGKARRERMKLHAERLQLASVPGGIPQSLPGVRPSFFGKSPATYVDESFFVRQVRGDDRVFDVPVHDDFALALSNLVHHGLLEPKEAQRFNRRLRKALVPVLRKGKTSEPVRWPLSSAKLDVFLIGRHDGATFIRRGELLDVRVRVRNLMSCCPEPPVPGVSLRVRVAGGLPGEAKEGRKTLDGFVLVVPRSDPAARKLTALEGRQDVPQIEQTPPTVRMNDDTLLDLDGDGVFDVAGSHNYDCIDDTCSGALLNAAGRWRLTRFIAGERYCQGGC